MLSAADSVFTVVNTCDNNSGGNNSGSLRHCVALANSHPGSIIEFDVEGPITLHSILEIKANTTIAGPGADEMIIYGGGSTSLFSMFQIDGGVSATISGLTLDGGRNWSGGAILDFGNLTVNQCELDECAATLSGGGIANYGTTTIIDTTLAGDISAFTGGAIANFSHMLIVNSTIAENSSNAGGGGIYNNGMLTTINCTIADNQAGASLSASATRYIWNSGGGIDVLGGVATLDNTIVTDNFFGSAGGSISSSEVAPLDNNDIAGTVAAVSNSNLIGTGGSGGLINGHNGNQVGVADAGLGSLSNYGGPTQTMALSESSSAVDAGNNSFVTSPPFNGPTIYDQRGQFFDRIVNGGSGSRVDIGAFEFQPEL